MNLNDKIIIMNEIKREIIKNILWQVHVDGYIYTDWRKDTDDEYKYYEVRITPMENTYDEDIFMVNVLSNMNTVFTQITASVEKAVESSINQIAKRVKGQRDFNANLQIDKRIKNQTLESVIGDIDTTTYNLDKEYMNG